MNSTYTVFVVRDSRNGGYLNQRAYSNGKRCSLWSNLEQAYTFHSAKRAQCCASNLRKRNPGSRRPLVQPVELFYKQ